MAAITICSDLWAQKNKVSHCFHCFPICLPWSDGTRCHDLSFLNVTKSVSVANGCLWGGKQGVQLWRTRLQSLWHYCHFFLCNVCGVGKPVLEAACGSSKRSSVVQVVSGFMVAVYTCVDRLLSAWHAFLFLYENGQLPVQSICLLLISPGP